MTGTVLVVTERLDPTADLIVRDLTGRGVSLLRCDAADFPQRVTLAAGYGAAGSGTLQLGTRTVCLEDIARSTTGDERVRHAGRALGDRAVVG